MNGSNMRLNNDVEEALGQGDCTSICGVTIGPNLSTACSVVATEVRRDHGVLKINHAEDEHYGMQD